MAAAAAADNPFAWLEPADLANVSAPFTEHALLFGAHRLVSAVSTTLGTVLTALVAHLILYQSKGLLETYKYMMLICVFTDACFNLVEIVAKPIMISQGTILMTVLGGVGGWMRYDVQAVIIAVYMAHLMWLITILPLQYFFRYKTVVTGQVPKTSTTLFLYFFTFAATIPTAIFGHSAYAHGLSGRPGLNAAHMWLKQIPLPTILMVDFFFTNTQIYVLSCAVLSTVSYSLTIYFAIRTVRALHLQKDMATEKTLRLQRQLSISMTIQAILPLIFSIGPVIVCCLSFVVDADLKAPLVAISTLVGFLPMVNPMQTIIVISPYRRKVFSLFRRKVLRRTQPTTGATSSHASNLPAKKSRPSAMVG